MENLLVNDFTKTESMILHLTEIIEKFKEKQKKRLVTYGTKLRKDKNTLNFDNDIQMDTFIIAMDNYFTRPKVMAALREIGIGVVGTSRFFRNWPSKKFKVCVHQDKAKFNNFYHTVDEYGTLVDGWIMVLSFAYQLSTR